MCGGERAFRDATTSGHQQPRRIFWRGALTVEWLSHDRFFDVYPRDAQILEGVSLVTFFAPAKKVTRSLQGSGSCALKVRLRPSESSALDERKAASHETAALF